MRMPGVANPFAWEPCHTLDPGIWELFHE